MEEVGQAVLFEISYPHIYGFSYFFRLAMVFMRGEYGNYLSKPRNNFGKALIGPIAQEDRATVS
jgi:hypothetical protein